MYVLGPTSRRRLAGVHPDLQACVQHAIGITTQDFSVLEGVRTTETQRRYVAKGASQTMDSRHLVGPDGYGHAVDLVAWLGAQPRWEWALYLPIADAMRQAGQHLGVPLRYGGGWFTLTDCHSSQDIAAATAAYVAERKCHGHHAFLDGPHFELARSARYP